VKLKLECKFQLVTTATKPLIMSLKLSLTQEKSPEGNRGLLLYYGAYRSQQLVPVVVNDRFVFDAVVAFLFDDRCTVSRLALLAGRLRRPLAAGPADDVENHDGLHGLAVWALAVVLGTTLAALVGTATVNRASTAPTAVNTSAAEPILSYELDRLFRSARRAPNADLRAERAEAGRILLTSSGHDGVSADDRAYLGQMVGATTGLTSADAERRVDTGIANSKTALTRSRRSTIILAFSLATALLLGAVAAWAAACAGGRHRDGAPLPHWMAHSDTFARRRIAIP
jgi:hypothetical protein